MTSDAQKAYLRRLYARRYALLRQCDCPGCDVCKGMVKGCKCDEPQSIREALGLEPTGPSETKDQLGSLSELHQDGYGIWPF